MTGSSNGGVHWHFRRVYRPSSATDRIVKGAVVWRDSWDHVLGKTGLYMAIFLLRLWKPEAKQDLVFKVLDHERWGCSARRNCELARERPEIGGPRGEWSEWWRRLWASFLFLGPATGVSRQGRMKFTSTLCINRGSCWRKGWLLALISPASTGGEVGCVKDGSV